MNINLEDYLNEDEIKEIVKEEFREAIKESIKRNGVSTWISNIGYRNVFEIINQEAPEYEDLVKENTKKVIENISSYCVFRKADLVEKEDSLAQKYLEESVNKNKEIINDKVIRIFKDLKEQDLAYAISDIIQEKIENMFVERIEK